MITHIYLIRPATVAGTTVSHLKNDQYTMEESGRSVRVTKKGDGSFYRIPLSNISVIHEVPEPKR